MFVFLGSVPPPSFLLNGSHVGSSPVRLGPLKNFLKKQNMEANHNKKNIIKYTFVPDQTNDQWTQVYLHFSQWQEVCVVKWIATVQVPVVLLWHSPAGQTDTQPFGQTNCGLLTWSLLIRAISYWSRQQLPVSMTSVRESIFHRYSDVWFKRQQGVFTTSRCTKILLMLT